MKLHTVQSLLVVGDWVVEGVGGGGRRMGGVGEGEELERRSSDFVRVVVARTKHS